MTKPRQRGFRGAAAVAALVLAGAPALAHGDSVLDLEPLEEAARARIELTTGREAAVWRRVARVLDAPSRGQLVADLRKLLTVHRALARLPAPDGEFAALLADAVDEADAVLAARPDVIEARMDRIAPGRRGARAERAAVAGWQAHQDVRTAAGLGVADRLTGYVRSARKYRVALHDTWREIARSGPVPTTSPAEPGHVYTLIGTGAGGFNGDGRTVRRTSLYFVDEVKYGPDGLLYVLDWNNHMVRCVEPDGTVRRICGSGTPGDSEGAPGDTALNHPSSIAFAPDGRVFLAAWHNHKVKVYDPNAVGGPTVYTIAGGPQGKGGDGGLATDARFNLLPGLVRLTNGDLLVTDAANAIVRRIRLSQPQQDENVAGVTVMTGPIERFAGQPNAEGYAGDGGLATDALLTFSKAQNAEPDGRMEVDAQGRVYVVCSKGNVIRRIDVDGTISTFAGTGTAGYSGDGGPATAATLNGPSDVAIAPDGTVYISDSNNNAVRRVDPQGTITTFAGNVQGGFAGDRDVVANARFDRPGGLELDADGNLLVCDRYNNRVRVVAAADPGALEIPNEPYRLPLPLLGAPPEPGPSGTIDTYVGTPGTLGFNGNGLPALATNLYWPQDCAVDPQNGLLYFLDWNNHRVRRVEDDGTVTTVVGSGQLGDTTGDAATVRLNHPTDLAFHPVTGELWVAGWHTDKVLRLKSDDHTIVWMAGRTRSFSGDGGAPALAELNLASSVKFDAAGNWYVADEGNRRIRFVDAEANVITTLCGNGATAPLGDGGPAALATLNFPVGQSAQPGGRVCLSPDERWLYVADTNNHRVRRIDLADPDRTITTYAGDGVAGYAGDGGAATAARLRGPTDVDCDAMGNLYIADGDNHAVRRVDAATGTITTFAGTGRYGFSGDGGAATAAQLFSPSGLFVDRASGRVFVADTYNGVIRVVWE